MSQKALQTELVGHNKAAVDAVFENECLADQVV